MAHTQLNITEENEAALKRLKVIAAINGIDSSNKGSVINFAIKQADVLISSLDEHTFLNTCHLKKSI